MRSLETTYRGYRMRSRLECRWAMFYDAMDVEWAYEPEAIDLGNFAYQPDFSLNSFRAWNEIKGEMVSDQAGLLMLEKCAQLAAQSDRPVILAFHDPFDPKCAVFRGDRTYMHSYWTVCPTCGELALCVRGDNHSVVWCPRRHERGSLTPVEMRKAHRRLYDAALAARQHRFGVSRREHTTNIS